MPRVTYTVGPARPNTETGASPHPLVGSVAAVDRTVEWMSWQVFEGDGTGEGWFRCDEVLNDPSFFNCWRTTIARRLAERYPSVPERTPAGFVLQWYLDVPAYTGAMLFHYARRVPSLKPPWLAFRLEPVWLDAIALRPGRFWCLPSDPERSHPDAVVVDSENELAAVLRWELVAHAARFLRGYGPSVRFGSRTLWAAVTDALDGGLLMAGQSRGDGKAGAADARLVLADRYEPLTAASTTRAVVDECGREHWTRQRGSCCFYYALPGAEPCATCPRVDDDERARILHELSTQ